MIFNSKQDILSAVGSNDPEVLKFLRLMKLGTKKMVDVAQYPEDYDQDLKEGDDGFIPKDFQEVEDLSTIELFGFTLEEVDSLIEELEK